ncbi:MAG: prolyl oligopeptidase family serine peptidase [Synechococcaceae cyanobacterium]|nr:prolyl oligopeptidase family serine peptidase [Synechococcaceae cyanobacterium]
MAVGRTPGWREPRLAGGLAFWLEQRPGEGGRTTLLAARPDPAAAVTPRELTPGSWNLRSRVHEYGGGAFAVDGSTVVFVHDGDRCLWALDLPADPLAGPLAEPRRLTRPNQDGEPAHFADGLIDRRRARWLGVRERRGRDQLVAVPLAGGEPVPLHTAADFCGYAVLSPCGDHLAWVEWQQPHMPWERSQLWLARLAAGGELTALRRVAGSDATAAQGVSVFQPLWAGADLVVANDRSGWWNLERLAAAGDAGGLPWQPLLPLAAEFAQPQWVCGLRTSAWGGGELLAAACRQGRWELGRVPNGPGEAWRPFPVPFDDVAGIAAGDGRLVAIAASPSVGPGLLVLDTGSERWSHTPAAPCPLAAAAIRTPEPLWFEGHGGRATHAWYYPPAGGGHPRAPLLVKGHSGPTGMARTGLSLAVQFWTSRGWGVVDVNYGGSTGFGRAYRERLDGGWGVVDVADCAAAARALVAAGRADPERVAIEGGSAAGFTVLAALCFTDAFRAGACRYAVADLAALARDTHRFEARYLDGLVGPLPAAAALYAERSPLRHAGRIRCPVIFFQGLEDGVVPPEQTERMALALSENGVPVEVHLFPGEGHGFRDSTVLIRVLEATEAFFRRHLRLA